MIDTNLIILKKIQCYTLSQLAHIFNKDEADLLCELDNYAFKYQGRRYYGVEDLREYIEINNIPNIQI